MFLYFNFWFFVAEYIFAALPRTQRGQPLVLGGDPKGKNILYTNGNSVIIRNIEVSFCTAINAYYYSITDGRTNLRVSILQNPAIADVYTEHSCPVNVAKYSPSGFYIASGGM